MKNLHLLRLILLMTVCFAGVTGATGQVSNVPVDTAYIYPENPAIKDSVYMTYVYISSDGCPDYYLVKDSVAPGKIWVSLKKILDMGRPCITVITYFKTQITLGIITRDTEVYFNGKLYKTIYVKCRLEKKGVVINCGGKLYIQEFSPLAIRQLYTFSYNSLTDSNGRTYTKPAAGDTVKFSGYLSNVFPISDTVCKPVGKVICYEITGTAPQDSIPPCVIDKAGIVVKCQDKLYFEDTSTPYASPVPQLYIIKGITDNSTGTDVKLKEGDRVKFGGYPVMADSATGTCHIVGVAACFRLIDTTSTCIMDKKGIVEAGIDGCTSQLFIRETLTRNLYSIKNAVISNSTAIKTPKPGDKVVFGGYLIRNDSSHVSLCPIQGITTCYRLIDTIPPCIMDKAGTVERGTYACATMLFVRETDTQELYYIRNSSMIYADGSTIRNLSPGDKVKFGAFPVSTWGKDLNLCNAVGIVNCYVITQSADTLTLSGYALAGSDTVKSGLAILFEKELRKSAALSSITDGTFTFNRLHPSSYTVYVIPVRELYRNYLPTFYVDKLHYKMADFVELKQTTQDVIVKMRYYERKTGTGKIFGNINYEQYKLNDSLIVKNALSNTEGTANFNIAVNTTVLLLDRQNTVIAWTLTDVNGNYAFTDIPLDTYTVVSETASASATSAVSLTSGQSIVNRDLILKSNEGATGFSIPENTVLSLFPNPVKEKLSITLTSESIANVYSLSGQLHIRKQLNTGSNTLDMSNMPAGIYILRIDGKSFKLIKY